VASVEAFDAMTARVAEGTSDMRDTMRAIPITFYHRRHRGVPDRCTPKEDAGGVVGEATNRKRGVEAMPLNCPGMNVDVLAKVERGRGLGDGDTQAAADAEAKLNAVAEALARVTAQYAENTCPPSCATVHIPKIIRSGVIPVPQEGNPTHFASIGWAEAQLDVLCTKLPAAPPVPPPGQPKSKPDDDDDDGPSPLDRAMRWLLEWFAEQEQYRRMRGE
jgi:hypothetical protein